MSDILNHSKLNTHGRLWRVRSDKEWQLGKYKVNAHCAFKASVGLSGVDTGESWYQFMELEAPWILKTQDNDIKDAHQLHCHIESAVGLVFK